MTIALAVSAWSLLLVLLATAGWVAAHRAGSKVDVLKAEAREVEVRLALALEEAKRSATEQLELATQLSEVYVWIFELEDGQVANARATFINVWESLGYEVPTEPVDFGTSMSMVILPEDQERVMKAVLASLAGETPRFEAEYRIRHKDGSIHWNLGRGIVTRDADGTPRRFIGTSVDITELKHAEEASHRHKERLELAILGSRACIWDFEIVDGSITTSRSTYTNVWEGLGYDTAEDPDSFAGGLAWLIPPEDQARFVTEVQTFLDGSSCEWASEFRVRHKDGSNRWHLARGVLARDANGRAKRLTGSSVDITDRKAMEQQLSESEQRWRTLVETLPQFVWTASAEGVVNYFSAQASLYTGIEPQGMRFADIVHPDDQERTMLSWAEALRTQGTYQVEHRLPRRDGQYRWFTTRGVAVRDDAGGPVKWLGTCTDITAAKQQEEELRHAKERLELAMRSSNLTIWEYDMPDGKFETSRETLTNVWESLGYEPLGKASESLSTVMHPEDVGRVREAVHAYLAGDGGIFEIEHRVRHQNGRYRWILARGVAVRDGDACPNRFVGTSVDITQIKQIEAELQEAREVAEAASRAKDEFLANVSHEIRTPMNAILGMTELAIDSARTEHQKQLLSTVKSAARNLLGIINDLLDFSKIAAGKLTLDLKAFSLRAMLSDTLRALTTRAQKKGLELTWHVQPDVPDALDGDAGRLRQVLMNLVGNAIKFTPRGHVAVEVSQPRLTAPPEQGVTLLSFAVRDTGIGIARDKQAAVFRAFEQEDSSTTRKYGGTGLGLTISARLVQLMGGQITVVSEPGQGSTFEFTVSVLHSASAEQAEFSAVREPPGGVRVLVVNGNEGERCVLVEWLTDWRLRALAVPDAMAAIEALVRAEVAGAPYSLALIDHRLPDIDGLVLAGRIRERFGARLVLLTTAEAAHIAARSTAGSIVGYLTRPLQQSEYLETLMAALSEVDDAQPRLLSAAPTPASLGRSALRILVAEDNELNVRLLSELLRAAGHDATFVSDGRSALDSAERQMFDLMLLDLHMPELDGFAVTLAIRERERTSGKHLPIVAFTARSSKRERERCLAAGMDDFLSKPIETTELWAAIERMVRAFPAGLDAGPCMLDARAVLRACGNDDAVLAVLRSALEETLPGQLESVRSALDDGDRARLGDAAHLLCGTLGAFSTVAAELASQVEESAANQPTSTCAALVESLEAACRHLLLEALSCNVAGMTAGLVR